MHPPKRSTSPRTIVLLPAPVPPATPINDAIGGSALRELPLQLRGELRAVFGGEVPVDRAVEPVDERDLGLPAEQPLAQGVVGHTVHGTDGLIEQEADLRLVP